LLACTDATDAVQGIFEKKMFRGDRICFLTPSLCKEHHPNLAHIQKLIALIVKGINAYHKLHPGELAEGGHQLEFSAQLAVFVRRIEYLIHPLNS
jgi:hypothetical protein